MTGSDVRMKMRVLLVAAVILAWTGCRRADVRDFSIEMPEATQADLPAVAEALLAFDGVRQPNQTEEMKKMFFESDRLGQEARYYQGRVQQLQAQAEGLMSHGARIDSPEVREIARQAQAAQQSGREAQKRSAALYKNASDLLHKKLESECFDAASHRLTIRYDSMKVAKKNIEMAIAKAGFTANGVTPESVGAKRKGAGEKK